MKELVSFISFMTTSIYFMVCFGLLYNGLIIGNPNWMGIGMGGLIFFSILNPLLTFPDDDDTTNRGDR